VVVVESVSRLVVVELVRRLFTFRSGQVIGLLHSACVLKLMSHTRASHICSSRGVTAMASWGFVAGQSSGGLVSPVRCESCVALPPKWPCGTAEAVACLVCSQLWHAANIVHGPCTVHRQMRTDLSVNYI